MLRLSSRQRPKCISATSLSRLRSRGFTATWALCSEDLEKQRASTFTTAPRWKPPIIGSAKGYNFVCLHGKQPLLAEENQVLDLEFVEEPLGLTAEQGYGYLQVDFGDLIGPGQRYEIVRKLGWGMNASVWLARNLIDKRLVAIKALKGYSTNLHRKGYLQELEILQHISSKPHPLNDHSTHCLSLLSHFMHPGKGEDGNHMCIVTDVLGGDVCSLRDRFATRMLPLQLVKRILRHTLLGLVHIHRCGVAHTDLKLDNIMMDAARTTSQDLTETVRDDPPRRHPPEASWGRSVEVAVSQPLPLPSLDRACSSSFLLADFGSAQFIDHQVVDEITPPTLRAPETILKGPWNEKVDIWTFGCLVFEFIAGADLFTVKSSKLQPEETLLFQMMCVTGERFMPDQLQECEAALDYFDPETCFLRAWPRLTRVTYQQMMSTYKTLGPEDLDAAAALIAKCLRLNPKNRASAEELLNDPWLTEA